MLKRVLFRVEEDVQAEHRLSERRRRDVHEAARRVGDLQPDAHELILSSAKKLRERSVAA